MSRARRFHRLQVRPETIVSVRLDRMVPQRPGRKPEHFHDSYTSTPPWDIGHPQAPFLAIAEAGELRGRVLDIGCGTGEHALMAAARGLDATGIDAVPAAIEM